MASARSKKRRRDQTQERLDASRSKRRKGLQGEQRQTNVVSGKRGVGYRPRRSADERRTETQTEWVSACIDEGFAGRVPGGEKGSLFPFEDLKAGRLQARGYFITDHNVVTAPELKRLVKEEVGKQSCKSHKVLIVPQTSIYAGWKPTVGAADVKMGTSNASHECGNKELRWVQTGMGPNYQGGVTTLTACRHEKRCTKAVMDPARQIQGDGTKLWLAVVVAKTSLKDCLTADHKVSASAIAKLAQDKVGKCFKLVSLHRIKQACASQQELWNSLSDESKKAKNNVENRIGDVFVPSVRQPVRSHAKEVRFYEEPNFHFRHWYEELYDPAFAERRRTQEDVSVRGGFLLRSYDSDETRRGTSFIFGSPKASPRFWDSNYQVGMVPHGGVIPLTQFLTGLHNNAPNLEAMIIAGKTESKKTNVEASASKKRKPWKAYQQFAIDARLRRLRRTHGYA